MSAPANMNGVSDSFVSSFFIAAMIASASTLAAACFNTKMTQHFYMLGVLLLAIQLLWYVVDDKHQ